MCDCFDNQPTFYNATTVKGRKDHRCCECLRTIAKGERHQYVSGLWDGDFSQYRTCQDCLDIIASLDCPCMAHGLLMNEVSEIDESRMTDAMRAFNDRRDANYRALAAERKLKREMAAQ